ncbi:MAG TPA: potassium channel family protein [Pyrinomonadaceae bacterium]|nr:potassium channel family protein [Pyrinomonadaceae bacterium]
MIFTVLMTTLGGGLLALVFYDVYSTILRATKRPGPISENLNRGLWWAATRFTKNLSRRWRHRLLTGIGPLLLPFLIALLLVFLVTGFALVFLPHFATEFKVGERETGSLLEAVYFSGITLLTVGFGDIVPLSGATRMLVLLEGASGISVISLGITYLLTVYGALEHKRAVALTFYHQAKQGADVASFITVHFARGRFYDLTDSLKTATRDLQELLETHLEHPVIHYFHPLEVYKGMPRVLFVMLETITILRSCLDAQEYVEAGEHPSILIAESTVPFVLNELVTALNLEKKAGLEFEPEAEETLRRRRCFNRATRELKRAGIKLRPDRAASFADYSQRREQWEAKLYWFADFLGYDWDEVTGDRDLSDATDDEIEERHDQIAEPRTSGGGEDAD